MEVHRQQPVYFSPLLKIGLAFDSLRLATVASTHSLLRVRGDGSATKARGWLDCHLDQVPGESQISKYKGVEPSQSELEQ
jgi:hypothetical protein